MQRRTGIAAALLGTLALAATAVVVPANAKSDAPDGTRVTQASQARQVVASAADSGAAQAAQRGNGYFTASGVNIRTGPSTNRTVLGQGQKGQRIQVHSCRHGDPNSWWYITNLATGVKGYVYWPNNVLFDNLGSQPPSC